MRFAFVLGEAASGLRRNLSMVVSVVLVTFISLTFVGAAALMQLQVMQMKDYWFDKAQVAVYLCTAADANCKGEAVTDEQREAVKADLESETLAPFIESYSFVDQDEAYKNFQEQFEGSEIASLVSPDQLNETFWIKLKDPSESAVIAEALGTLDGVQSVVDQRSYLDQIFSILNTASFTAIGIAALMLVAAALLISTTIRLSAFSRRRELGIMRLVGASNSFVQTPFVLEGVISALIGAVLACGAVFSLVHFFVQGYVRDAIMSINFIGTPEAFIVMPLLIVVGVLVAAVSANIAITRYLKV